jgi:hypothetical protein
MGTKHARVSRRQFLLGAAAGSTAVAGALVSPSNSGRSNASQDKQAASQSGYRVTEHVRNYYRTARI